MSAMIPNEEGASAPEIVSFGFDPGCVDFRASDERFNEELYRSIPSLAAVGNAILTVSNGLSQDARRALFYGSAMDPDLRVLKIEHAIELKSTARYVPDLEWMAGVKPPESTAFETKDLDGGQDWLAPDTPATP